MLVPGSQADDRLRLRLSLLTLPAASQALRRRSRTKATTPGSSERGLRATPASTSANAIGAVHGAVSLRRASAAADSDVGLLGVRQLRDAVGVVTRDLNHDNTIWIVVAILWLIALGIILMVALGAYQ